jgi:hypothetical protein
MYGGAVGLEVRRNNYSDKKAVREKVRAFYVTLCALKLEASASNLATRQLERTDKVASQICSLLLIDYILHDEFPY